MHRSPPASSHAGEPVLVGERFEDVGFHADDDNQTDA
jgi:hypothetical protein